MAPPPKKKKTLRKTLPERFTEWLGEKVCGIADLSNPEARQELYEERHSQHHTDQLCSLKGFDAVLFQLKKNLADRSVMGKESVKVVNGEIELPCDRQGNASLQGVT